MEFLSPRNLTWTKKGWFRTRVVHNRPRRVNIGDYDFRLKLFARAAYWERDFGWARWYGIRLEDHDPAQLLEFYLLHPFTPGPGWTSHH